MFIFVIKAETCWIWNYPIPCISSSVFVSLFVHVLLLSACFASHAEGERSRRVLKMLFRHICGCLDTSYLLGLHVTIKNPFFLRSDYEDLWIFQALHISGSLILTKVGKRTSIRYLSKNSCCVRGGE